MTKGELVQYLNRYKDDSEILIFPEAIDIDDQENEVILPGGIGIFDGKELEYIGDVQFVEEVYEGNDVGFELDDYDDDELDIGIDFDEEQSLN